MRLERHSTIHEIQENMPMLSKPPRRTLQQVELDYCNVGCVYVTFVEKILIVLEKKLSRIHEERRARASYVSEAGP